MLFTRENTKQTVTIWAPSLSLLRLSNSTPVLLNPGNTGAASRQAKVEFPFIAVFCLSCCKLFELLANTGELGVSVKIIQVFFQTWGDSVRAGPSIL
jgi:hypothetical protein